MGGNHGSIEAYVGGRGYRRSRIRILVSWVRNFPTKIDQQFRYIRRNAHSTGFC